MQEATARLRAIPRKAVCALMSLAMAATMVIAPVATQAAYAAETYTVTFDANGGELEGDATVTVEEGGRVNEPDASRDGWTLKGWYKQDGSRAFFPYAPKEDETLTAEWCEGELLESGWISFDKLADGEVSETSSDLAGRQLQGWFGVVADDFSHRFAASIDMPYYDLTAGFDHAVLKDSDGNGTVDRIEVHDQAGNSHTKWLDKVDTLTSGTIEFADLADGARPTSVCGMMNFDYLRDLLAGTFDVAAGGRSFTATLDGSGRIVGLEYIELEDSDGDGVADAIVCHNPDGYEYSAALREKHMACFHLDGGEIDGETEVADQVVDDGSTLEDPGTPTRDGYRFAGWYCYNDEGGLSKFTFGETPVTRNINVVATWTKIRGIGAVWYDGDADPSARPGALSASVRYTDGTSEVVDLEAATSWAGAFAVPRGAAVEEVTVVEDGGWEKAKEAGYSHSYRLDADGQNLTLVLKHDSAVAQRGVISFDSDAAGSVSTANPDLEGKLLEPGATYIVYLGEKRYLLRLERNDSEWAAPFDHLELAGSETVKLVCADDSEIFDKGTFPLVEADTVTSGTIAFGTDGAGRFEAGDWKHALLDGTFSVLDADGNAYTVEIEMGSWSVYGLASAEISDSNGDGRYDAIEVTDVDVPSNSASFELTPAPDDSTTTDEFVSELAETLGISADGKTADELKEAVKVTVAQSSPDAIKSALSGVKGFTYDASKTPAENINAAIAKATNNATAGLFTQAEFDAAIAQAKNEQAAADKTKLDEAVAQAKNDATAAANEANAKAAAADAAALKAVKGKVSKTYKAKKSTKKLAKKKAFKVTKAAGATFAKVYSSSKSVTISKAGKVTVKKGAKKGTYKLVVLATYGTVSKVVVVTVKVK